MHLNQHHPQHNHVKEHHHPEITVDSNVAHYLCVYPASKQEEANENTPVTGLRGDGEVKLQCNMNRLTLQRCDC